MGALRQLPVGAQGRQDGHGDHDAAGPRRHFINVEDEPTRNEQQFGWNRRNKIPANRPNQRQVKTNVGIGMLETAQDRKSTRLNSSHQIISYAVFCLKKKKKSTK